MKTIVIGTRNLSFSAINSLTKACAASSDVPLRAMIFLPRLVIKSRPSRFRHRSCGARKARSDSRPALQRVGQSLRVIVRKAEATSLRAVSEVAK
jgi:hypothetical protein